MVGGLFPSAWGLVDLAGDEARNHRRRQKEMVDADALVALPAAVVSVVPIVVKMLLSCVPIVVAPMMIITEIKPTSRPYSIAAAPSSSRRKLWIAFFMMIPP